MNVPDTVINLVEEFGQIAYKLYNLTYEECKTVDPEFDAALTQFKLSPDDYKNMSIEELAGLEV